jgi:predicted nucleic acid-binding protein
LPSRLSSSSLECDSSWGSAIDGIDGVVDETRIGVEAFLATERKRTGKPFKGVVNDLLREVRQRRLGERKRQRTERYALKPLSVGRVRHEVVNVTEALELAEGDDHVPDAQLAAPAIEHGLILATHDRGFARFEGLRWELPLVP